MEGEMAGSEEGGEKDTQRETWDSHCRTRSKRLQSEGSKRLQKTAEERSTQAEVSLTGTQIGKRRLRNEKVAYR